MGSHAHRTALLPEVIVEYQNDIGLLFSRQKVCFDYVPVVKENAVPMLQNLQSHCQS